MSVDVVDRSAIRDAFPTANDRRNRLQLLLGFVIALAAARLTYGVFSGLRRARVIIDEFELAHGPLQYTNGWWDHRSAPAAASQAFCDELDAAAGWVYPFGAGVWLPVAMLWVLAISIPARRTPRFAWTASVAVVVLVVVAAGSFGSVYADVIAVLE